MSATKDWYFEELMAYPSILEDDEQDYEYYKEREDRAEASRIIAEWSYIDDEGESNMHCLACDRILSDYEATRKYKGTQVFIDLCANCFSHSDLMNTSVVDQPELANSADFEYDGGEEE